MGLLPPGPRPAARARHVRSAGRPARAHSLAWRQSDDEIWPWRPSAVEPNRFAPTARQGVEPTGTPRDVGEVVATAALSVTKLDPIFWRFGGQIRRHWWQDTGSSVRPGWEVRPILAGPILCRAETTAGRSPPRCSGLDAMLGVFTGRQRPQEDVTPMDRLRQPHSGWLARRAGSLAAARLSCTQCHPRR